MQTEAHDCSAISLRGTPSAPGLAMGHAFVYDPAGLLLSTNTINPNEVREEQQKVESAFRLTDLEIRKIIQLTSAQDEGGITGEILEFQRSILKDPELAGKINHFIRTESKPADTAIYEAFRGFLDQLKKAGSPLFRERIPDIREIRDRLIRSVQQKELIVKIEPGSIVVCRDLSPGEIILFARKNIGGVVSEGGGLTSHASIIANSMGIPFIIGVDDIVDQVDDGDTVILNGNTGEVIIRPDAQTVGETSASIQKTKERDSELMVNATRPGTTKCGRRILIQANVEIEAELANMEQFRAEGIGLLRTESYFYDLDSEQDANGPSPEDTQREFLQRAAAVAGENDLTVRLYDVGGDKVPSYARNESNPFLGWRGVRVLLDRPVLLRRQLDLIFSTLRNTSCTLKILVPMISDVSEITEVKKVYESVLEGYPELRGKVKFGIMIEVPSAALLADKLAPHVDFFSIGTNDLTQYTMAADRSNRHVQALYKQMHPAVWKLIALTCESANAFHIPVSVCGEIASDPGAACLLVGLGANALSMNSPAIPEVKALLAQYDFAYLKEKAEAVLQCTSADEAESIKNSLEIRK